MLIEENPYGYYGMTRRRKKARRNPGLSLAMPKPIRKWTQGVDLVEAGAAAGGLALAGMLPGMLVKDTSTTLRKILKIVVAAGGAVIAGIVGKSLVSPAAGKAAIIGGLGGVTLQAVNSLTTMRIGELKAPALGRKGGIGGLLGANNNFDREVIG